jgi:DNA-binding response OmpR family regulator
LPLVVEDDVLQRETLSDFLEEANMDVIQCESAEAAELVVESVGVEHQQQGAKEGSGLELAAFAQVEFPELDIVIVLANDELELPEHVRFLSKPYRLTDIL